MLSEESLDFEDFEELELLDLDSLDKLSEKLLELPDDLEDLDSLDKLSEKLLELLDSITSIFKSLGAKVISVEPNPIVAEKINNDIVIQKACSDTNGTIELRIPNTDDEIFSLLSTTVQMRADFDYYHPVFSENKKLDVETITLDSLIINYGIPKYVKIDVEGAEISVLKGLTKKIEALSFEIIGMQPDWRSCFDEVERLGEYEYTLVPFEDWVQVIPWGTVENAKDYFASHAKFRDYYNVYCRIKDANNI